MSHLRPNNHTNLQYTILNISANILKILKENIVIEYAELLDVLKQKIGDEVNEVFLLSLSFLYMHKKIEYIKYLDAIRLVDENI